MQVSMRALIVGAILVSGCSQGAPTGTQPSSLDVPEPGSVSEATKAFNASVAERLPLEDQTDFERARRGFLAKIETDAITDDEGNVVWPIKQYDFLEKDAPDSVNPSLWRQSQLAAIHGLFQVTDGVYQVRGYDLSVMSIIQGETGWIIVDPLTNSETAAASLKLVNDTLGERPVTGLLYTHSHADHFGGARGVLSDEEIADRNVPVLAPIGFSESAVSENLIAGNQMSRRATLMFGNTLARNETGHVGSGLGPGLPNGTISLILPTEEIEGIGTTRIIDGVTFEFVDAAGTEAPAEFMFYLPEKRALCTAEVATATFHNLLTPRGAKVRDSLKWSRVIDHVLAEYGAESDVVFASHHWPTWGTENVEQFLTSQRDIYRYVHDQTVRRANAGADMFEAAEAVSEPEFSEEQFNTRGYYGTLNHNAKAVYQHYFGWWGGNPADYYRLPSEDTAERYVEAMGGAEVVIDLAKSAYVDGDYRWAAELLNKAVFANPSNEDARQWLASAYDQLGFQAESGAWRSYFLTGAKELREGLPDVGNPNLGNPEFLRAVPSLELFDSLAARYNPEKLSREPFAVTFNFTDREETITLHIGKSVLVPREGKNDASAATVTMTRASFDSLILGEVQGPALVQSGEMAIDGNPLALRALFGTLETPEFWFNIVEP